MAFGLLSVLCVQEARTRSPYMVAVEIVNVWICLILDQTNLVTCLIRNCWRFLAGCCLGYEPWLVVWKPLSLELPNGVFGRFDLSSSPLAVATLSMHVCLLIDFSKRQEAYCHVKEALV